MSWVETASATFTARHDARDTADARHVLGQLERARRRLEGQLGADAGELAVVLHGTAAQLDAAAPWLPLVRRATAPASRRYVVGWAGEHELHVLAPRLLAQRASNSEGSLELLMLTPVALLARRTLAAVHPRMPPPMGPLRAYTWWRSAWLVEGAAQWLAGQTGHVRPAVARRLREGPPPSFPPSRADALLLGGTVFDLLAREAGEAAALALARHPHPAGSRAALRAAFDGRPTRHTEAAWRSHLQRVAAGSPVRRARAARSSSA